MFGKLFATFIAGLIAILPLIITVGMVMRVSSAVPTITRPGRPVSIM